MAEVPSILGGTLPVLGTDPGKANCPNEEAPEDPAGRSRGAGDKTPPTPIFEDDDNTKPFDRTYWGNAEERKSQRAIPKAGTTLIRSHARVGWSQAAHRVSRGCTCMIVTGSTFGRG